ncbi:hypothetical protein CHS0354_043070 [Potamilus streckersoni]|uniref:Plexin domain-containing protein 2 n=1 Tax=Potamilus streckersoni TaxID=2493646 RepID=A0AAE0SCP0_9BIVA|nr:hypothetical protein CHS0354_043070 [Potamilus streckersoni]
MAFKGSRTMTLLVFVFVLLCVSRHNYATEDIQYRILGQSPSFSSVINFSQQSHSRYRRQNSGDFIGNNNDSTPLPTTTTDPLANASIVSDDHAYYTSQIVQDNAVSFWVELENATRHETLSDSHKTAITAKLNWNFPFYGHNITNVTIATGGFLYMSPFLHQWLTATQYIAPLMANFDSSIGNNSEIYYKDFNGKFVVEWRDIHLKGQNSSTGDAFKFQTILHQNGSIVFVYKQLPIEVVNISTTDHPVKIGLSDAFYIDTTLGNVRRRTIYEYHRVSLDIKIIKSKTVILLHPKPTCNIARDCDTCLNQKTNFTCKWCGIVNRCSDSVDWHRQEWLDNGCLEYSTKNCSAIPTPRTTSTTSSTYRTTTSTYRATTTKCQGSGSSNCSLIPVAVPRKQSDSEGHSASSLPVVIAVVVIVIIIVGALVAWFVHAYRNPTSASGIWLMEHRPSQMKAKLANMRFWKNTSGSGGDKYKVEAEA